MEFPHSAYTHKNYLTLSFQVITEDISALLSFLLKRLSLIGSSLHPCALVLLLVCYFVSHPALKVKSSTTSPPVPAFAPWHMAVASLYPLECCGGYFCCGFQLPTGVFHGQL